MDDTEGQTAWDKSNSGYTPLTRIVLIITTDFPKIFSILQLQSHYKLQVSQKEHIGKWSNNRKVVT